MLVFEYDPVTAGVPASGSVTSGCINVTVLPVWLTEYTLLPATIFPGPVTVCPTATFTRFDAVAKVILLPAADADVVNVPPNDTFPPTETGTVPTLICSVYVSAPSVWKSNV